MCDVSVLPLYNVFAVLPVVFFPFFFFLFHLIMIILAPSSDILYSVLKQSLILAGLQWLHITAQINTLIIILHYF